MWNMTPEWIQIWILFLSGRCHVYFWVRTNQTMLTFKLVSCCRLREEQICHYDDKQTTSHLNSSLMSTRKSVKVHLRFTGVKKTPGTHKQLPVWCLEMWHHATNKSQSLKGYMLFSLLLSSFPPACTQAREPSGDWLFKQHVPIKSELLTQPSSLSLRVNHRVDRRRWGRSAPSAVEVFSSE